MPEEADRAFEKAVEGRTIDKLRETRLVSRGEDEQVAEFPTQNIDQNGYRQAWGEENEGARLTHELSQKCLLPRGDLQWRRTP